MWGRKKRETPVEEQPPTDETDLLTELTDPDAETTKPGRFAVLAGWGRVFKGNKTLWITAIIAVGSMAAGLLVGAFVISPADAAANADAPTPGYITAPVEFGELSNDVTIRADVGYADAAELVIDTASVSGAAVVTGQVPEVGAELNPLSVALEVAGRPVIVLPGELPAYRSLRFGVSGPDVVQLKQALREVGIDGGDPSSNVFDEATAAGVSQLYAAAGYPTPASEEGSAQAVSIAESSLRAAEQSAAAAQQELANAGAGPSAVAIREADNQVAAANRALNDARAAHASASEVANLEDALALTQLQRDALFAQTDTSAARASVDAANAQVSQAQEDLTTARQGALAFLPSSEVVYLSSLPRRVDTVNVQRGTVLQGAAMTVSGATVQLTGSAAEADAQLLEVGAEASFELSDGTPHRAVVVSVARDESADAGGRFTIELEPDPMPAEEIQFLQGSNVRVSIPVAATDGAALSVPVAALTAGPGGESRVEVVEGDPRDIERAETRLVTVETGLSTSGAVEVTPIDGELDEGDLVIVGR